MKTLTVKQPWAYLICVGLKDIENRTWKTNFRGRVLIHASASPWGNLKVDSCFTHILTDNQYWYLRSIDFKSYYLNICSFGAIIGSVEIVDCVINHPSIWAEKTDLLDLLCETNYKVFRRVIDVPPIIYNWVLANPILFDKPIPCKGHLSFWEFDETLIKEKL